MEKHIDSDAPKTHKELGQWITCCGPKGKATTHGLVTLSVFMLSGLGCVVAGALTTPQPGDEALGPCLIGIGIAVIVIGVICLLYMTVAKRVQVDLYSNGIRIVEKGKERFISWDQMATVKVFTLHDSRFSNYRVVTIESADHEEINFDSKLQGQPDRIIRSIIQNAPNVKVSEVNLG